MAKITRESLLSNQDYARERARIRSEIIQHKKNRTAHLGDHLTVLFEDERTMRYQVQEMLHIEHIADNAGISDELDAYNPLIPDGSNWKATLLIEYSDVEERRRALVRLRGVEHCVWVQVADYARTYAIADEDLERENDAKTSAVHFLRFELSAPMADLLRQGAAVAIGCDHPDYNVTFAAPESLRAALREDLV